MSRPLRIEFPGAVYHVTSRGDRREAIFEDDVDRSALLEVLAQALDRFEACALAWCLMGNHYHFVIHTQQANLSLLMRHINGVYTQRFNKRHNKVGHLFQGRFKAVLVDKDSYMLEVCRYVDLNPVRAGMVDEPGDWPWSSYLAHSGQASPPAWLDTSAIWGYLLGSDVKNAADAKQAADMYKALVTAGRDVKLWDEALRQQVFLGDEHFVQRMQDLASNARISTKETPKTQRAAPHTVAHWLEICESREEAIVRAYRESKLSMTAIAQALGLSVSRISRILAKEASRKQWDIFCNVVDNFGDIGVCWRLACNLAARGKRVRLWVDDVSPLAWMAPSGCAHVEVIDCKNGLPNDQDYVLGDVLVDTFDCEFAINLIAIQAINTPARCQFTPLKSTIQPLWLNLEYLTAESFAERAHTLPYVHHSGAAQGWTQRYFYPGFNERTGGLLRETDLFDRQKAFDRGAWLNRLLEQNNAAEPSFPRRRESMTAAVDSRLRGNDRNKDIDNTRFISLFCYEPAALEALIDQLAASKIQTCLLVTYGRATTAVKALLEHKKRLQPTYLLSKQLSILYLPQLTQIDFDHLLWSCNLNFVRGEDSLVRAIWAGKPFIWQIYPQHDGAHNAKLDAFLQMMDAPASLKTAHTAWNASAAEAKADPHLPHFPQLDLPTWAQSAENLSTKLRLQADLASSLIAFAEKNG